MIYPKKISEKIRSVMRVYKSADEKTVKFKAKTGLDCVFECGECCRKSVVTTTVLEVLPVAADMFMKGEHERWIDAIDVTNDQAACVFYSNDVLANGGHCRIYPWRPLICRVFGFAMRKNKYGRPEFMTCHRIKEHFNDAVKNAGRMVSKGMADAADSQGLEMRLAAVEPLMAKERLNINQAFVQAVEYVGLACRLYKTSIETATQKKDRSCKKGSANSPVTVKIQN